MYIIVLGNPVNVMLKVGKLALHFQNARQVRALHLQHYFMLEFGAWDLEFSQLERNFYKVNIFFEKMFLSCIVFLLNL